MLRKLDIFSFLFMEGGGTRDTSFNLSIVKKIVFKKRKKKKN